jgi:hypothetical protein
MREGTRNILIGAAVVGVLGAAYMRSRPASERAAVGDQVVVTASAFAGALLPQGSGNAIVNVTADPGGGQLQGSIVGFVDQNGQPQSLPAAVPGTQSFPRNAVTAFVKNGQIVT